jgi:hypothetical protein
MTDVANDDIPDAPAIPPDTFTDPAPVTADTFSDVSHAGRIDEAKRAAYGGRINPNAGHNRQPLPPEYMTADDSDDDGGSIFAGVDDFGSDQ